MVRKQPENAMTIAGLARAGGVSIETIRYYQRRGLLRTPERSGSPGHGSAIRRYSETDVRALRFIRSAQLAGFTLEQISELLALDVGTDRLRARELALQRIAALSDKITELTSARDALSRLAKSCSKSSDGPCPIISAFDHG